MTIEKLSDSTILVCLERGDMESRGLDFDRGDSEDIRRALAALMSRIGEECGLDHRGRSYLIEALPGGESCLLIISVKDVRPRKVYRIKREKQYDYCIFAKADDMLDLISARSAPDGEILLFNGSYILLPRLPLTEEQRASLSEYGRVGRLNAVSAARAREYGRRVYFSSFRKRRRSRGAQ